MIIFTVYEFSVSFIPIIITMVWFHFHCKKHNICISNLYYAIIAVLTIYITAVLHFTGVGTIYDIFLYKFSIQKEQINIIPFSQSIDITAYLLNILLFIPLGFLMPFISRKKCSIINVILNGFSFTLFIELSQLLNNRRTDIDDIILNTIGAVIGFLLYNLFIKITKPNIDNKYMGNIEIFVFIAIIFMSRFLLFNETVIARLIYKF